LYRFGIPSAAGKGAGYVNQVTAPALLKPWRKENMIALCPLQSRCRVTEIHWYGDAVNGDVRRPEHRRTSNIMTQPNGAGVRSLKQLVGPVLVTRSSTSHCA